MRTLLPAPSESFGITSGSRACGSAGESYWRWMRNPTCKCWNAPRRSPHAFELMERQESKYHPGLHDQLAGWPDLRTGACALNVLDRMTAAFRPALCPLVASVCLGQGAFIL